MNRFAELPNLHIQAETGTTYAYRDTSGEGTPLFLLQHFRGNLDSWDPALVDALAENRRVVAFDYEGVGGSSGRPARTVAEMATGALTFIQTMELNEVDVLGFSIGSFVAQQMALCRPQLVNRLVLASSAPKGAPGMHGWPPDVIGAVGNPQTKPEEYLEVFFANSDTSQAAGKAALQRMYARTEDRDVQTNWECRVAQYDAVCEWGIPNIGLLERVRAITVQTFVANGDSDPMILPRYSHLLAGLLPHATLKIYADSAHGFLFQHHEQFAADVHSFLG